MLAVGAACVLCVLLLGACGSRNSQKALENLKSLSANMNKSCPVNFAGMVLQETSVEAPATFRLRFESDRIGEREVEVVSTRLKHEFCKMIRREAFGKIVSAADATLGVSCTTSRGEELFDFEVRPEEYRQ